MAMAADKRTTKVKSHTKISAHEMRIMTINMSTKANKETGDTPDAEQRRLDIDKLLQKEEFDIIMAQEIAAPRKPTWLLNEDSDHPHLIEYNYFHSEKEAGIMLNKKYDDWKQIDAGVKEKALASMKTEPPADKADLNARTCVVLVSNADENRHILCISYHGPYKISTERKESMTKLLQTFAVRIQKELEKKKRVVTDIVIGGDFNMDMQKADCEHSDFNRPVLYELSKRREDVGLLDTFLNTKNVTIDKPATLLHGNYCRKVHPEWTLDHDPVVALIHFKSTKEVRSGKKKEATSTPKKVDDSKPKETTIKSTKKIKKIVKEE